MITFVCGVILDSISAGSMFNDSSDSANTGRAPCITMELKHEYHLGPARSPHHPDRRPRPPARWSGGRARGHRQGIPCLHPRASSLSKVSTFIGGWPPAPYQRNGKRFKDFAELEELHVIVIFRAVKARRGGQAHSGLPPSTASTTAAGLEPARVVMAARNTRRSMGTSLVRQRSLHTDRASVRPKDRRHLAKHHHDISRLSARLRRRPAALPWPRLRWMVTLVSDFSLMGQRTRRTIKLVIEGEHLRPQTRSRR